jgi:hypothetical protein
VPPPGLAMYFHDTLGREQAERAAGLGVPGVPVPFVTDLGASFGLDDTEAAQQVPFLYGVDLSWR